MRAVVAKGVLNKKKIMYIFILLLGIIARVYRLSYVPEGINQDEAFAAREA